MSYEEEIAWGVQQMLDADLQFPQDVPVRNVVKTNADHIRSLTDEELAKFLMKLMGHAQCFAEGIFPYHPCPQNQNCKECGVDWLKQPYKEEV